MVKSCLFLKAKQLWGEDRSLRYLHFHCIMYNKTSIDLRLHSSSGQFLTSKTNDNCDDKFFKCYALNESHTLASIIADHVIYSQYFK